MSLPRSDESGRSTASKASRSSRAGSSSTSHSASKRIVARRSRSYAGHAGQAGVVRVAGPGERDPGPVHGVGDALALGSGAREHLGAAAVEVVEHERDLERVGRPQDAAEDRASRT